jgi:hypothetical protein
VQTLRRLSDPADFLDRAQPFLRAWEVVCVLMLGDRETHDSRLRPT